MFWMRFAAAPLIGIFMLSKMTTESGSLKSPPPPTQSPPEYHYYNQTLSWYDAHHFCRIKHSDLATVTSVEEAELLAQAVGRGDAWIGLRLGGPPRWLWSDGARAPGAPLWQKSEPNSINNRENCTETRKEGWNDLPCTKAKSFVCQSAKPPHYFHESTLRTWADARDRCRSLGMDLPTVHSWAQNREVLREAGNTSAWIGLFLDLWAWSDGSPSSLRHWLAGRPVNLRGCAVVSAGDGGHWDEEYCGTKMPFVCRGGLKSRAMLMRLKMHSDGILDPSAARPQLLQQLEVRMKSQGISDFTLSWRSNVSPQAEMKESSAAESCGPEY